MTKGSVFFYVATGAAVLGIAGVFGWSWFRAARDDATPRRPSVASQLMKRKAQAIADLRKRLAAEDYHELEKAIARLGQANAAASLYLSEREYGNLGQVFRQALDQFRRDVEARDLSRAQSSFAQLTGSCIACHQLVGHIPLDKDAQPLPRRADSPSARPPRAN